jgi:hypothetical protein
MDVYTLLATIAAVIILIACGMPLFVRGWSWRDRLEFLRRK